MLKVIETFTSLQGESTQQGRCCFFIRLAGCNLRCTYCDTAYAWEGGTARPVADLVTEAKQSGAGLVEVTGGEPLTQPETPALLHKLLAAGLEVMLETNGTLPVADLPHGVRRIIDVKLPGSGMAGCFCEENFKVLNACDELKFVIASRGDFDCALEVVKSRRLQDSPAVLLASPIAPGLDPAELARWIIAEKAPFRMQIQLHKLLWGDRKGV